MTSAEPSVGHSSAAMTESVSMRPQRGLALDYLPVPERLRPFVTTLFHFSSLQPHLRDYFPAIVGLVSITLRGRSAVILPGGKRVESPEIALLTPTSAAMTVEAEGPFDAIGAVFSPLGWAALVGLHAQQHSDRLYDGRQYLGPEIEALVQELRASFAAGSAGIEDLAQRIAAYLVSKARRVNPRHAEVIRQVALWMGSAMDPPLSDLFARCGYSERQVERLVQRYYGCPPKLLVRKYRALRVMALLLSPDTTPEQAAALVDLYYDQSHMIRDLRQFAGRTPTQMADNDTPVLAALVDIRNYRQIDPRVAPLPKG